MNTAFTFFSLFEIFLITFIGILLGCSTRKIFNLTVSRIIFVYIWHTVFCFIYILYLKANGGDAIIYYQIAINSRMDVNVGTDAVIWFTAFFTRYLGLSFVATSLIYNIIGFIGLIAFDASLKQVMRRSSKKIQRAVGLLVFLPSISFWSSGIGKDSIVFMAIGLALWASLALGRRWLLMLIAVLLMLLVRPHIAGIMVLAITLAGLFMRQGLSIFRRVAVAIILITSTGLVVPFALKYAGLSDLSSLSNLSDYLELRQSYNQEGGGGIDISQLNFPLKLFTYLFRPLPFEAKGIAGMAASVENIMLMVFFLYALRCKFIGRTSPNTYGVNTNFLLIYGIMAWVVLAMTTANLGISLRQKWMFMPIFLYLAAAIIGAAHPARHNKRQFRQIKMANYEA